MGQSTTFSSRVNKTEQAALASLKEKVKLMHKARLINWLLNFSILPQNKELSYLTNTEQLSVYFIAKLRSTRLQ